MGKERERERDQEMEGEKDRERQNLRDSRTERKLEARGEAGTEKLESYRRRERKRDIDRKGARQMALRERCAVRGREGEIVRGEQDTGTEKLRHRKTDWKGKGERGGPRRGRRTQSQIMCTHTSRHTHVHSHTHTVTHMASHAHTPMHAHTATHTQSHTHSHTHQGQARRGAGRHGNCISSQKGPSHSTDPRQLPEAPRKPPVPADPVRPFNLTAVGLPFTGCAPISKLRKSPGLLQRIALRGQVLTSGSRRLPGSRAPVWLSR